MKRKLWIATGLVVTAVGVGAVVAHAERGGYGGHGYRDGQGDWGREGRGRHHGWRRGHDGPMSKADYDTETRSKFAAMDANTDGVVDKAEIEAALAKRMEGRREGRRGGQRMQRRLARYDANNDGKVTLDEVKAYIADRFQRMDLNGDGKITDEDLPPIMRGMNVLSGGDGMGMAMRGHGHRHHAHYGGARMIRYLTGADANKDGAVTLDELQARAGKRFARFDRNKDGAIDQADRDQLRKEMSDYRVLRFMHRYGATDGKLTLEQYTKVRNERFAKRDRDGDGMLGGEGSMRGHHGRGHMGRWDRDDERSPSMEQQAPAQDERGPEKRDTQ